jgi:hypothetical protein
MYTESQIYMYTKKLLFVDYIPQQLLQHHQGEGGISTWIFYFNHQTKNYHGRPS